MIVRWLFWSRGGLGVVPVEILSGFVRNACVLISARIGKINVAKKSKKKKNVPKKNVGDIVPVTLFQVWLTIVFNASLPLKLLFIKKKLVEVYEKKKSSRGALSLCVLPFPHNSNTGLDTILELKTTYWSNRLFVRKNDSLSSFHPAQPTPIYATGCWDLIPLCKKNFFISTIFWTHLKLMRGEIRLVLRDPPKRENWWELNITRLFSQFNGRDNFRHKFGIILT